MALGIMRDGGMVEQFRVPANKVLDVPAGLDVSSASLAEPAAVAWHGVRLGGAGRGGSVAVVGGGSIGQLAAAAAQTQGADDVVMEARYPHQHRDPRTARRGRTHRWGALRRRGGGGGFSRARSNGASSW